MTRAARLTPLGRRHGLRFALGLGLAVGFAALRDRLPEEAVRALPALVPVLGFGAAAWWFGRSLLPGREPLIVRWNRHDPARDPAASAPYARRLTGIWTVALALMALASLAAVPTGGPEPHGVFLVNWVLALLLFLGEHVVRALVFRDVTWPSDTIRAVLRAERARRGG